MHTTRRQSGGVANSLVLRAVNVIDVNLNGESPCNMSLCFRALPGKLSSFVSGRKPLSKLDRHQLQKHVESSAFLKQFLGTQRTLSVRVNVIDKESIPPVTYALHQNLSFASFNAYAQQNVIGQYNDNENSKNAIYWAYSYRSNRLQRLSIVGATKNKKHVAPIEIPSNNITLFQMRNVIGNDKNNSFLDNSRRLTSISEGNLHSNRKSNIETGILFMDNATTLKTSQQQSPSLQDNEGKPSQERLQCVLDCLSQDLPKLFVRPPNYLIYTEDLIFINNIRGVTTKGRMNYIKQVALLRAIGHFKFAHVKFDIIKITMHTEDATVKVRWRIKGISSLKMLSMFWKFKSWKIQEAIDQYNEAWYDGFSTFYVNDEGRIYKHVADKMMPDQDVAQKKDDIRITPKLALFTGLTNMLDGGDFFSEGFCKLYSILGLHRLK